MSFLRQIKYEVRNILKSRFLLVIAILAILSGVYVPVTGYMGERSSGGSSQSTVGVYYEPAMASVVAEKAMAEKIAISMREYPGGKGQPVTIDGVTVGLENPLYWNLQSLLMEKQALQQNPPPVKPAALDLMLKLMDEEAAYYLTCAKSITQQQDYRMELVHRGTERLHERFLYENADKGAALLEEMAGVRKFVDPATIKAKYIDIPAEKRLAGLDAAASQLALIRETIAGNDFPRYIAIRIEWAREEIKRHEENIAIQEAAIIKNPAQEENLSEIIDNTRKQIKSIETGTIPILEFRLKKTIVPGQPVWQNNALNDIENSRNQLSYLEIKTEKEWNENQGGYRDLKMPVPMPGSDGGQMTYRQYVAQMQAQIDQLNKTIVVAQKSLDSDRPDMKYVPDGSRRRTMGFLNYSLIVMLFGVLIGGWLIASEHQQGTIRLLMIRPKTRTKILLSKFTAALIVWLAVDLIGSLLNLVSNGVLFGFTDFGFPIYSVAGETNFILHYLPRLLACMLPILFSFTVAFMLSVVVRNSAVSIALPIVFYIASFIVPSMFALRGRTSWIAYTPIPYMQMPTFFNTSSIYEYSTLGGLNLTYGILLLLCLSVICTGISVLVFKKRDIVN